MNRLHAYDQAIDQSDTGSEHIQLAGCGPGEIDYTVRYEWSAIIYFHDAGIACFAVHNQEFGAKRQTAMSCRQFLLIVAMPIGCLAAMEFAAVPGGLAAEATAAGVVSQLLSGLLNQLHVRRRQ